MKNFKTLLLIAVLTLGIAGVANAQKVAHVDFQRVIENMPEARALETTIQKLGKTYQDEIEEMSKKLEVKYNKYKAEQDSQTQETNDARAQEVKAEGEQLQQARQVAYQEIQAKQNQELAPIVEKARKAINALATEKGISYILDEKSLIVSQGEDLYDAIKAKLGLLADKPKQ